MTDKSTPTIIEKIDKVILRALMTAPNSMMEKTINDKPLTVFEVQQYKHLTKAVESILADFAERITPEKEIYSVSKKMADKRFEEIGVLPAPHSAYRLGRTDVIDTITQNVKAELGAAPINSKEVSNE